MDTPKRITSDSIDKLKEKMTLQELKDWRPTREMWETGKFHLVTGFFRDNHSDYKKSSPAENVRL